MDDLNLTPVAFFAFLAFIFWLGSRQQQRDLDHRYRLYRAMVEHPGPGADAVRRMLEEDERRSRALQSSGANLGGLVVVTVGILLTLFLYFLEVPEPVYLLGLIPLAVGILILVTARRGRQ